MYASRCNEITLRTINVAANIGIGLVWKVQQWMCLVRQFLFCLKWPNKQDSGHKGQFFQTELMVQICSESLVRAIGKVLLMKFRENTN